MASKDVFCQGASIQEQLSTCSTVQAEAKNEIMKGDKLGRQSGSETSLKDKPAEAAKSEIMKEDKLHRQGGSGSQERNDQGRQASQTRQQRQPNAKS